MVIQSKLKDKYVYLHYLGFNPVYVGQGSGPRVFFPREYDWDGYRILAEGLSNDHALELESFLIDIIGYENLENKHKNSAHGRGRGFKGMKSPKRTSPPWNKGLTKEDPRVAKYVKGMTKTRWNN